MWTAILDVVEFMLEGLLLNLPMHKEMGLVSMGSEFMTQGPGLILLFLGQVVHLGLFFSVLSVMMVLELARLVYAAWMLVKRAIPLVG